MPMLMVMRHAKSSWKNADSVHDSERKLNKRGRRDAARMGAELRRRALFDEDTRVFVSRAARARETYELLREGAGVGAREAVILPGLYEACHGSARAIVELLRDDETARAALASSRAVLLIGHNPGLEALVRLLLAGADADGVGGEMGLTLAKLRQV